MDKELSTDEHHHSQLVESTRNEDILRMRSQGSTLQEIGIRHGLTRERVRQVLLRSKGPTSAEAHTARLAQSQIAIGQLRTQVKELMDRGVFETSAIAKTLSITDSQVRSCLSAGDRKMLIKPVIQPKLWEDEEILSALKEAASLAGNLTVTSYAAAVKTGAVDGPTPAVVLHRFGGWVRACEAAGIVSISAPRKRWGVSSSQILNDLIRFLDEPGTSKTAAAYERWARSNNAISLGTIRNKIGGWSAALILARKRQHDR
jgi:DNA-binding CsgD family transcriptional regulator